MHSSDRIAKQQKEGPGWVHTPHVHIFILSTITVSVMLYSTKVSYTTTWREQMLKFISGVNYYLITGKRALLQFNGVLMSLLCDSRLAKHQR